MVTAWKENILSRHHLGLSRDVTNQAISLPSPPKILQGRHQPSHFPAVTNRDFSQAVTYKSPPPAPLAANNRDTSPHC
jgi:hypothetical protein